MPVEVRYYTDPACAWSWGAEPKLRHLIWEFGDSLEFRWIMGGLARNYDAEYRDELDRIGSATTSCYEDLMARWLDAAAETGMPFDPRIWSEAPLSSTYPACQAVKAAAEQGAGLAYAYLRRLREGIFCERMKLDHAAALIAEAGPAGLDVERFRIDLQSHAITEAFAADLDEVRDVPDEVREAGLAGATEGRERISFPSALFVSDDGTRDGVWGSQPYEAYREAALAAGAAPITDSRPGVLGAIERFGRCATRELEELTGMARPVVEAEVWSLAKEWRLKPQMALTGTLWELG